MAKFIENLKPGVKCSFCGKNSEEVKRLISGRNGFICSDCVNTCVDMLEKEGFVIPAKLAAKATGLRVDVEEDGRSPMEKLAKPAELKAFLDRYIVGQDKAKKTLSVAVYNHYKRLIHLEATSNGEENAKSVELQKSNILLLGPTGCGKTYIAPTLANILFICGGAFAGMEKIIEERMNKRTIGFGAKVLRQDEKSDIGEILQHVQSGDILKYGLIPELCGRLPVITPLRELDRADLVKILTEPKNALTKQYKVLLSYDNVELEFTEDALNAIADKASEMKIGARALRSIVESVMTDAMYEVPGDSGIRKIVVTRESVIEGSPPDMLKAA
jgi:ATP-dependent protease Clp ATPase subunit